LLRAILEAPEYAAEVAELPRRQQLTYATRAASAGSCQRIADRADLLGEQAHVVGVGEHLLEDVPAFIDAGGRVSASTSQNEYRLNVPPSRPGSRSEPVGLTAPTRLSLTSSR
jgi:hypothetical protein